MKLKDLIETARKMSADAPDRIDFVVDPECGDRVFAVDFSQINRPTYPQPADDTPFSEMTDAQLRAIMERPHLDPVLRAGDPISVDAINCDMSQWLDPPPSPRSGRQTAIAVSDELSANQRAGISMHEAMHAEALRQYAYKDAELISRMRNHMKHLMGYMPAPVPDHAEFYGVPAKLLRAHPDSPYAQARKQAFHAEPDAHVTPYPKEVLAAANRLATLPVPKPPTPCCKHTHGASHLSEWPNPAEGVTCRDHDFAKLRAEQDVKIRQHYARTLREWPTCSVTGKTLDIVLWGSTNTNDRGPMVYTYGLTCMHCRKACGLPTEGRTL